VTTYSRKTMRDRRVKSSTRAGRTSRRPLSVATLLVFVALDALLMSFCLALARVGELDLAKVAGGAAVAVGVDIARRGLRHGLLRRAERDRPRLYGAAADRVPRQRRVLDCASDADQPPAASAGPDGGTASPAPR
jgi:hypothetical protein